GDADFALQAELAHRRDARAGPQRAMLDERRHVLHETLVEELVGGWPRWFGHASILTANRVTATGTARRKKDRYSCGQGGLYWPLFLRTVSVMVGCGGLK